MVLKFKNKNREIPLSIGYYALKQYKKELGRPFKNIDLEDLEGLGVLIWYGIEAGYKHEDKINPIQREEIDMILDSSLFEILALIPDFFPRSLPKLQEALQGTEIQGAEIQGTTNDGTGVLQGDKPERMS